MNKTIKISFCGIITALCLVVMLTTGVIPVGTYALPAIAGVLITIIVIEVGIKWAAAVFACVSILSLFLAGDKEAVVYFILFFGYYPIIKNIIERYQIKKYKNNKLVKFFSLVLKVLVFNIASISAFFISVKIILIDQSEFYIFGVPVVWPFLIVGNITFIIYDYAFSGLIVTYFIKIQPILKRLIKFT